MSRSHADTLATCFEEAGHAVRAIFNGRRLSVLSCVPRPEFYGLCAFDGWREGDPIAAEETARVQQILQAVPDPDAQLTAALRASDLYLAGPCARARHLGIPGLLWCPDVADALSFLDVAAGSRAALLLLNQWGALAAFFANRATWETTVVVAHAIALAAPGDLDGGVAEQLILNTYRCAAA
jgi:hypothetical protein